MKVALVHDQLREYGGAERVVEVLHEMYPEAPLYTAFVDWKGMGKHAKRFADWDIRASWVDRNWIVKKLHSPLRFLTPLVWESFDLRGFDVVISSSGWYVCRGVITQPETLHVSYIHHPPRNLYGYPTARRKNFFIRAYGTLINPFLRLYDYETAQRVDFLVANSKETKRRIQKYYRRDAEVIYPPVTQIRNSKHETRNKKKDFFLVVGRLTYAKKIDLAIQVCNELKLPLKIVGTGRDAPDLKSQAGGTVEFLGSVDDDELAKLYRESRGLIFTALQEDFGMVPVEAMAQGTAVIALRQGGVVETVIEGKTGVFFDKPSVDSLSAGIKRFEKQEKNLTPKNCINQSKLFSKEIFKKKMSSFIQQKQKEI